MDDPYSLDTYDFNLPEERIAQNPLRDRDRSKLLLIDRKSSSVEHHTFSDLVKILKNRLGECLLVSNNSKVIRARLLGHRIREEKGQEVRGGKIEFLMLEQKSELVWEGLFHAAAKHKPGIRFEVETDQEPIRGEIIRGASNSPFGTIEVRFNRDPLFSGAGEIPLPPYIRRPAHRGDQNTYQTVYAKEPGSSAAPTAGFHFTSELINKLRAQGIGWEEITLHVGLGTFRPVAANDVREHSMHEEFYSIDPSGADRINSTKSEGRKIVAVGTTSLRALESSFREGRVVAGKAKTDIFFYPGSDRKFNIVDALITNFHLPKSTLFMLVCAFAGTELAKKAYQEAIEKEYRFYSYGDATLIL